MISRFRLLLVCAFVAVAACTSPSPEGQPSPELTSAHLQPVPVRVSHVQIDDRFHGESDIRDVSSTFPTAPDVALRRYAETRLQPAGMTGTLNFIIHDAHIYQQEAETGNKLTTWTGLDRSDVYDVSVKLELYVAYMDGAESNHAILNLNRTISIPQRFSLAQKEQEKLGALELLMADVDRAVTQALISELNIAGR